ncbi:MAG: LPS-assembly protein LptD [Campylobacterota bacterium]|nr:LPS-assembly protein LptD [Campylobacterota bacterium]
MQILAQSITLEDNVTKAQGNVVVYSPEYYMTADKLNYNETLSTVELFGDVNIAKKSELFTYSDYTYLNLKNNSTIIEPLVIIDNKNKLWFNAQTAKKQNVSYELDDATLSSCDCNDPDWSIGFSQGDYNTTSQWLNTYDTTLYIKSIPVLYTPYFGFSTNRTRKSGLLKPTLGYSKKEGLLYAQPFYYAPEDNYDLEYIPQFRSKRGSGHALKYRHIDSIYSELEIQAGIFNEKTDYKEEAFLENKKHYGFNIDYERDKLFSHKSDSDGLLISYENINDIDYINTKYNYDSFLSTDKFLESQLKYFYNTNNLYSEFNMKYYDDLSMDNNDQTLQQLPLINLYKYSSSFLFKKLIYSANVNLYNQLRNVGIEGKIISIDLPISYSASLFDDFIHLKFKEYFKYSAINYDNFDNMVFNNARYGEHTHYLSVDTDLIKSYNNYIHTLKIYNSYAKTDSFKEDGDIYGITNESEQLKLFEILKAEKSITIGVKQSIFDKNSLKEIVKHKIEQSYIYDDMNNSYISEDLLNDFLFTFDGGKLSNRILYNHTYNKLASSSTQLTFNYDKLSFDMYHIFEEDFENRIENKETLVYKLALNLSKRYVASYKEEYNINTNESLKKEFSINTFKKCWDMSIKLIDGLVATNTSGSSNLALRQKKLYLQFDLKRLFEMDQIFELN